MKKKFTLIIILLVFSSQLKAQSDWYTTQGGETIFSLMNFNDNFNDATVLRFSPVFNWQSLLNKDISKSFGIFTGIAFRNVGFIADDPDSAAIRKKFRTYNVAVPVGFKFGNLDRAFIYAGFDAEYAFNYKEKTFVNGDKEDKDVYWFSNRIQQFQPSVFMGFQLLRGTNIKFKYYLNNFFNPDRTDVYQSDYERFDGNIFYFSLNADLFYKSKFYYSERD